MTAPDATRLAGGAYCARLVRGEAATPDDKTRLAQEGYQSRLARGAPDGLPDAGEFYKLGERIGGRYEVSAIHHGELGVVYGCFDHRTKLPRALKTVRARHASDKQVLSLFESEAVVWISLEKHPYIVRAYLVELFENRPYVITEYVRGPEGMEGDLRGWLGHPRLTLSVAVAMALQIAQGMQHAVRKVPNLVHRDLKPANILVNGDGKAMVTDFGLVRAAQSGAGTPAYMSPEQWRAEPLDARSDIYAYGCILFEMFTAHRLFPALTERDWKSAHLEGVPVDLTQLVPELPGDIDRFVRHCLEKQSVARPQNWDEIVAFFAQWYHRLTGKAVLLDFSSLALDATEWIDASYSLVELKRYEDALLACNHALALDQNDALAWSNKGIVLYCLNRYEETIRVCDRALTIDPNNAAAWYSKGHALYRIDHYEEAVRAYDQVLAIEPIHAAACYSKGLALYHVNRYEEAIQAYDQALAIDQNHVAASISKGNALYCLKRYEEALEPYDQALAIDPNNALAWDNKGRALYLLNRYEEAIQAYDHVLAIDQSNTAAWSTKASVLRALDRYEEAIQAYDRVLAIDANDVGAWTSKASMVGLLKRHEDAVDAYDRVLAIDQNDATAWYKKGVQLYCLKRNDEVLHACDRALAINPNYAVAWNQKGDALLNLKRYDEAIEAYDRALASDPNESAGYNKCFAWIGKGHELHKLKRYEEAIDAFEQALTIDSNYALAWFMKGSALGDLKRYDAAIQAYDRALAIEPNDRITWTSKGDALTGLKRCDEAIQAYDRAIEIDQNFSMAWRNKGAVLRNLKRYAEALDAYYRALTLDPNRSSARDNRAVALQLSTLAEGATVKGIVKNITDYGAVVDLGGIDGLLHITDLAWRRVKHPSEVLSVGDELEAKVLRFDQEKNRVSLGLKQLSEDPWTGLTRRYPQGTRLFGKVSNLTDYGAFVEIEAGIEGLVHVSEMDWTNKNVHPSKVVQLGDEVEVMVLEIDEERRRISLGMKQCMPNPSEDFERRLENGDALAEGKHYEQAVAAYDQALALKPADAHAWYKKGNALLHLERYEEALSAYEHASPLDTKGGVSFIKGFTLQKLKRYEEAIVACDRALAINPSLAIAQETKSFAQQELKRHEVLPSGQRPQSFWSRLWEK